VGKAQLSSGEENADAGEGVLKGLGEEDGGEGL